ncbi:adenosylmethionine decarboxylase [Sphingomonas elodea]|uniref:adenosylmethionine decarboxylase n=1 Tax=Sphingomonas elodea TaxID=179878 RepID=UPI0002631648|nr:adenosylmethionine decarboxylase [Sphingomonas elodea]
MSGQHLIADLRDATRLADIAHVEACLVAAAAAAGATLLEVRLHGFGEGMGVTGVALLAESHISIHTWPEHGTACVDIFLCAPTHDLHAGLDAIVRRLEATVARCTVVERHFDCGSPSSPRP